MVQPRRLQRRSSKTKSQEVLWRHGHGAVQAWRGASVEGRQRGQRRAKRMAKRERSDEADESREADDALVVILGTGSRDTEVYRDFSGIPFNLTDTAYTAVKLRSRCR